MIHSIVGLGHWYLAWPWWEPGFVSEALVGVPLMMAWPFWGFKLTWNVLNPLMGVAWGSLFLLYGFWFICHQSVLSGVGVGLIVIVGFVGVQKLRGRGRRNGSDKLPYSSQ